MKRLPSRQHALRLAAAFLALLLITLAIPVLAADPQVPVLTLDNGSHTAAIRQIAVDASENLVVTAGDDKSARVWDIRSGEPVGTLHPPVGGDHLGRLYAAAVSPGGMLALAGTTAAAGGAHRIYLYNLRSMAFVTSYDARGGDIKRLQWSPDGKLLAAAYAGEPAFRVFDDGGRLVHEETLPADAWSLTFSASGMIALPVSDQTIRLYQADGNGVRRGATLRASLPDPRGVHFSPQGNLLAVGYLSRKNGREVQVDVFDLASAALARSFVFDDIEQGNLRNVAWQSDGAALYAGGSGYRGANSFVVKRIAWPDGAASDIPAATNSVTDLLPLKDGRLLFATVESSWGVLKDKRADVVVKAKSAQFYDSRVLSISDDAGVVAWRFAPGGKIFNFSVDGRRLREGPGEATRAATPSGSRIEVSGWENSFKASVAGKPVPMQPTEIARASAVLPDEAGVVLATSRALRRFDASGSQMWMMPLATEARAVNVSADGRVFAVAMADGTIRWRRVEDGAMLMSLFATPDGKWVLWTEDGYFDAGMGSESLIGWTVNRKTGEQADYYPISRFREHYFRPDVLDRMLVERDPGKALASANAQRQQLAQQSDAHAQERVRELVRPAQVKEILPPVVTLLTPGSVESSDSKVTLEYRLFAPEDSPPATVYVRVDGRPYELGDTQPSLLPVGETAGKLTLTLPQRNAVVQVFASNANGTSAPATMRYTYKPRPAEAAPPPRPADKRPTLYLLAVGVGDYANPKFKLNLPGKDADDFTRSLRRQSGLFYKHVEARVLVDRNATREAVLQGLTWLKTAPGPDDVGILFIAGHGVNDVDDTYYFLTHDSDVGKLAATAIPEAQFRDVLSNMRGKTLFFVDTCYSGKSLGILSQTDLTRIANKFSSPEHGVIVFSASHGRQQSLESIDWGNGAFTKALVAGIDGAADYRRQGVITHRGLDYYLGYEVASLTNGMQTPVTMVPTGVADFPVAKGSQGNKVSHNSVR
ncbi:MAG TPA: caspase family protein [Noviherbaspirillum sp.]|uniref:caspase family protein n=1 Tax=Noviherbaspirillum sp. TaxID=1926288 RepID=UPI002D4FFEB3|nr:caspase family protein [Noviherbaspirillum sp.]HYD97508.1 caspase family protein [Noviherbaspirillum sp.]